MIGPVGEENQSRVGGPVQMQIDGSFSLFCHGRPRTRKNKSKSEHSPYFFSVAARVRIIAWSLHLGENRNASISLILWVFLEGVVDIHAHRQRIFRVGHIIRYLYILHCRIFLTRVHRSSSLRTEILY